MKFKTKFLSLLLLGTSLEEGCGIAYAICEELLKTKVSKGLLHNKYRLNDLLVESLRICNITI